MPKQFYKIKSSFCFKIYTKYDTEFFPHKQPWINDTCIPYGRQLTVYRTTLNLYPHHVISSKNLCPKPHQSFHNPMKCGIVLCKNKVKSKQQPSKALIPTNWGLRNGTKLGYHVWHSTQTSYYIKAAPCSVSNPLSL